MEDFTLRIVDHLLYYLEQDRKFTLIIHLILVGYLIQAYLP